MISFEKDYQEYLKYLDDLHTGKIVSQFIKTDISFFNYANLKLGSMIVLAGRTGEGKTTMALNLLFEIIRMNSYPKFNAVFFSLEMSKWEIFNKISGMLCHIDVNKIIKGFTLPKYEIVHPYLNRVCFYDDIFDIENIIQKIQYLKFQDENLKLVFIDYLGLTIDYSSDRYLRFGKFTRKLHLLSKKLNLLIVILVQLNRHASESEEPELYHLRDSGSIEQDAEQVFLIYRNKDSPEYLRIKIGKNRFGPTDQIGNFYFYKEMSLLKEEKLNA